MADLIVISPTPGQNVCVVTITLDVATEKAAAVALSSGGATMAQVKAAYGLSLIPRLYRVIDYARNGANQTDSQINAARDAEIANSTANAAAVIAGRATVGNPIT